MVAWWVWVIAGCVIGMFEILAPAFVFLGFAIGAVLTGLILWAGVPPTAWMGDSLPRHLLVFAVLSLVAWVALRAVLGLRRGQVKVWDRDINDN